MGGERTDLFRRIRRWILVLAVGTAITPQSHAAHAATAATTTVPGRALVRFAAGTPAALEQAANARVGATIVGHVHAIGYDVVSFPSSVPLDVALSSYRSDPSVLNAEPDYAGRVALTPSDSCLGSTCTGFAGQWQLAMTNAPFAWDAVPGRTFDATAKRATNPVTIAVLDTHVDTSHPDWTNGGSSADSAQGGQLDLADAHDWLDSSHWSGGAAYHGTFVAGLAAASAGNGRDAAGIGYASRIMPLTVVDGGGNTDAASLADAIVYAWQHNARVINLSLGILGDSQAVHDAIRTVVAGNAAHPASLVVAAAGNNTGSSAFYPGSYPEVMSVSGTDASDNRASCSNYNANVSVSAPADRLIGLTVMPAERIQAACGTSAAAPQVSGLASLLFAQDPARTPAQVRTIIERSADDLGAPGRDDYFGNGRINAERALRYGIGPLTTSVAATIPSGGTSTITAVASSASGVRAAQLIFGSPDAAPVALQAADGSFGGTTEAVRTTFTLPSGTTPGAHPIWIRAFDGTTWGAAAVGVLYIDAQPPTISGLQASDAVRAANQPLTVTFTASDDRSKALAIGIEFRSQTTNQILARITRTNVTTGAQTFAWQPALTDVAGPYLVKVAVADEVGNVSVGSTGSVVT
jgi:subtilisin family serine protease